MTARTLARARTLSARTWALAALGATLRARIQVLVVTFVLFAGTRRRRGTGRRFHFDLRIRGVVVPCTVTEYADLVVMREIFVDEQYANAAAWEPSVIVDLGSNSGFSVLFFRIVHPEATIVAVEPDPSAFAKLLVNTRGWPGIVAKNVAIAGEDGTRTFYTSAETWTSSLRPASDWRSEDEVRPVEQQAIAVETRTLGSLMREVGIDRIELLKLDIEGAEWEVIPQLAGIDGLRMVLGELHFDIGDAPRHTPVADVLAGFDVRVLGGDRLRPTIVAIRPGSS